MKSSAVSSVIDGISGIFQPIIGLLSAAGVLKGVLIILTTAQVLSETGDTYLVFNAMADSLFYFLPMLLAFTAAKKFGANPFTAVVIGGVLLYPTVTEVFEAGNDLIFAGLPMRAVTYHSSVIPILLAVGALAACCLVAAVGGWQLWQGRSLAGPDPTAGVAATPAVTQTIPERGYALVVEDAVSGARAGHAGGFRVACVGDAAAALAGEPCPPWGRRLKEGNFPVSS